MASDLSAEIRRVTGRRELKEFIFLPEKIHKGHPLWVPPVYYQEMKYFNQSKNRAFIYSDYMLALAYRNGRAVGRIMGIVNKRCNEFRSERNARFSCLECPDDQTVAHALLSSAENWAAERGMEKIVGPMGFNNQDPSGFLTEGFEHQPTFSTYYNFDYVNRLLTDENYSKEVDYVVYKIDIPDEMPDFYRKIYDRIIAKGEYKVHEFTRRRQLEPYIVPILGLMNEGFAELYGYQPLDNIEMNSLAKRYLTFLDPRFVKAVTKDGQVIGFNIAMPNISDGIRKAGGRLFPFGFIHILSASKKTEQLDTLIGGIKKEYRGRGIDVAMGYTTILSAQKAGLKYADSHHELEDNVKVRAEMERLGGKVYKRFRIYKKELKTQKIPAEQ
jgi:GNAT superfamily N-acetyltransferase